MMELLAAARNAVAPVMTNVRVAADASPARRASAPMIAVDLIFISLITFYF
jgi:hypothetical protein